MADSAMARLNSNPSDLGIVRIHTEMIAMIKYPIAGFLSMPTLDFRPDIPNYIKRVYAYVNNICGRPDLIVLWNVK
jgi:hypothetical protein